MRKVTKGGVVMKLWVRLGLFVGPSLTFRISAAKRGSEMVDILIFN